MFDPTPLAVGQLGNRGSVVQARDPFWDDTGPSFPICQWTHRFPLPTLRDSWTQDSISQCLFSLLLNAIALPLRVSIKNGIFRRRIAKPISYLPLQKTV